MDWVSEKGLKMLNQLVEMAIRLGRDPTFKEVDEDPTMPKGNDYAYDFGSFTDALKKAHRIAFSHNKPKPPLPVGKKTFKQEEKKVSRRTITDEEYVVGAIRLQKELGHFPDSDDIKNDERCPSDSSYRRRFGTSWVALKSAILLKAKELGIDEDNVDNYSTPEPKAENVAETILDPEDNREEIPEVDEELNAVAEPCEPTMIINHTKAEIALPSMLSGISAEPIMSSEVETEGNKLISLLPQTKIISPKVEGYATVFTTNGVIPLHRTVLGVPVSQKHSGLSLLLGGRVVSFPEPQEGIFYIVERKTATAAKISGRDAYDLLIPEKYDTDRNGTTIVEFSVL